MAVFLTQMKRQYVNLRGYHTRRRLLVIESDDWGSIRMPSRAIFENLQRLGDAPEQDAFLSNDCLESRQDLERLFQVLRSVRDKRGRPAVITANFATANPDFDRINPQKGIYYCESILDTYRRYYPADDVFSCVKAGMAEGVFFPQLHCREHLNVNRWMNALWEQKPDVQTAFDNRMIGIGASFSEDNRFGYMDAFNTVCSTDEELAAILEDAAERFRDLFGFDSETFVASCFVWNTALEKKQTQLGIKGIQSASWQNVPIGTEGKYQLKRRLHFTGERNRFGQVYTVRNCTYEPAYQQNPEESVQRCLKEIERSFADRKPAIITSHRFNYIWEINPQSAERNLTGLRELLTQIVQRYPDVEFITSLELVRQMQE